MNWRIRTHPYSKHWKIRFQETCAIPTVRSCSFRKSIIRSRKHPLHFVLVCGQNVCGQLGLSSSIVERQKPQPLKSLNENIQSICAGAMHSCALTIDGRVYTWGCNDDGALARQTNDMDDEYRPGMCSFPEKIQQICAGDSFSIALAQSGRVYISGCFRSSSGIIGLIKPKQVSFESILLPFERPIKQISCGADFCLLLTENGELYSFGSNETGQLGRDTQGHLEEDRIETWLQPGQVSSFQGQKVLNIWAGGHGFFALVQNSRLEIFACGANSYGQLGHPSAQAIFLPVLIESLTALKGITRIACGLHHTLILDVSGHVYGLGRSDDGRLGPMTGDILFPQRIESLMNIIDIAAGGSVSFALDDHRQIFSFGMGTTCQTGHGSMDVFHPTLVQGKQLTAQRLIEEISVGAQHTLFLVRENE